MARVKNSTMILFSLPTSIIAASRFHRWQFAAIEGGFLFLGTNRGKNNAVGSNPKMNSIRDYRHNCGVNLESIVEQIYLKSGGCILGSIVPK